MTLGSTVSNAWSYFNESKKRKHEVMNGLAEDASDPKPNHSTQASFARSECGTPAKRPRIDNQTMPNNGAESTSWFVKFKTTLNNAWDKLMGHHGNSHSDDGASTSSAETNCDSNRIIGSSGSDSVGYQSPLSVEPSGTSQNEVTSTQHFDPRCNYMTPFEAEGFEVKRKKKFKFTSYFAKMKYRDLLNRHLSIRPISNRKPTANPINHPEVVDLTDDEQHIPLPIAESTSHSIGESSRETRFKTDIMDRNSKTGIKMIKRIREIPPVSYSSQTTIKPLWSVDRRNKLIATQSWTSLLNNSPLNTKNSGFPISSFNDRHSTPRSSSPNESQDLFTNERISQRRASMATLPRSSTKFKGEEKQCNEFLEPDFVSRLKKSNEDLSIVRKMANTQISVDKTRNKRETDVANLGHKIREPINRTEIQPFGAFVQYIEIDDKEEEGLDEEEEEEEEEEGPSSFPLLTPEMVVMIEDAWVSTPPNQVLCEGPTGQICRKDMETLKGLNWLNDEIINFYLSLIVERGKNDNFSSVYAFNTFFYKKLRDSGPQSLKRWTRRVDVFANDFIFIPIHLGMHWCLAVINFIDKKIEYYDSMGGRNDECVNALKDWLQAESMDKKKVELPMSDWTLVMAKGIPQQNNGSDCGMFSCKYAEYISRKAKINFSQAHMPYFRRRMVYEILTKQLL